eukprot:4511093-Amphidinium_carterae.1
MKKTLMTDGVDGFQCKICKACFSNLPALIDHYAARHFNIETHIAMQKRVFNIAAQSTSRDLGTALEIIKRHGKRLTPTWDFEAYRAEVMQVRGRHYGAQTRQNQCATRIGDDQWGTPHSIIDRSVPGEIPMKGRSKLCRAESRRIDRHSDPASSRQKNHVVGPVRKGTAGWYTAHSVSDSSVTGRPDPDRRVTYGVEHQTDESVPTRQPKKRQRSGSSYSERDSAEVEIQDLRSQLVKERRRNQELEAMAERAEHHSEMASTISQLMRAFK